MANEDGKNVNDSDARGTAPTSKAKQKPSDPAKKEEQSILTAKAQVKDPEKTASPFSYPNVQAGIFAGLAILGTAFLLFGVIGKNQILDRLSNLEHARGLITFILTVGTISIAILVTLGALMGRDEEAKERFYRAKEILTILIGVLGTIVGFYFGSQDSTAGRVDLRVATPILSAYTADSGDPVTMTSYVSGGSPPYKYEISFQDNRIESVAGYTDDTGWIIETIKTPQTDKNETIQYTLKITGADEETASYISAEGKHIVVEPK